MAGILSSEELVSKMNRSLGFQEKALGLIPGMNQLLSKRPDQFSYGIWPGYYRRAKGANVWDLDGNKLLDMSIAGIGANVLGYADEDVDKAVIETIRAGVSSSLNCPEEVELAELLVSLHHWADMAKFTRAGGESLTLAVRIARAYTDRDKVAFCGYHGWHDWYLASNLGSSDSLKDHLLPGLDSAGVPKALAGTALPFHYNKPEELEEIITKEGRNVGTIVMESVRGQQPENNFLEKVREIADRNEIVLIFDEVSAGFRLNPGGAHLNYHVDPDIAVFAKALGNGYPIGAVIGRRDVMQAAQKTFVSSTNWTERVGPTAALAMIKKYIDSKVERSLIANGKRVKDIWCECAQRHGVNVAVGGLDPMAHFAFLDGNPNVKKAIYVQSMLQNGILASNLYYAMYAHADHDFEAYAEAADWSFAKIGEAEKSGTLEKEMHGNPSVAGFKRLT